jgi:hypothetical protein
VQDWQEQQLLTRALTLCARRSGTQITRTDRTRLSAFELIMRAEETLGTRERCFVADWLGARVAVRALSADIDRRVSSP